MNASDKRAASDRPTSIKRSAAAPFHRIVHRRLGIINVDQGAKAVRGRTVGVGEVGQDGGGTITESRAVRKDG